MTYPPQQPDPYGQQTQHGQPQAGGHPAPQQPGAGMPPGGYPPQQPGGQPPQPPGKRQKTGVLVGVILAVLLLAGAAVAITGFWQPGYFRDDPVSEDLDALRQLGEDAVTAINNRDEDLAREIGCEGNKDPDFSNAKGVRVDLSGEPRIVTADTAALPVTVSANGKSDTTEIPAKRENGSWCVGR